MSSEYRSLSATLPNRTKSALRKVKRFEKAMLTYVFLYLLLISFSGLSLTFLATYRNLLVVIASLAIILIKSLKCIFCGFRLCNCFSISVLTFEISCIGS